MKKIFSTLLSFSLLIACTQTINAASEIQSNVEYLEDGSYFVTTIQVDSNNSSTGLRAAASTRSGSKTVTYKSSSGASLWSVTVKGSFSYVNGSSAKCTSSTVSTAIYSTSWKISNKSSSKSGHKASATATGTQYMGSTAIGSITKTVILTCSVNGTLS